MAHSDRSRRAGGLTLLPAIIAGALLVACTGGGNGTPTGIVGTPTAAPAATPPCNAASRLTPGQTEGPYFKDGSPERVSLIEPGMAGTPLIVSGTVMSADCKPVAGALLDVWQADDNGDYDNVGFRLRGHQFTNASGRYRVETIIPGLYTGRTEHIHVKVQAPNRPVLTTQLYFAGVPENASDTIFDPGLVMDVQVEGGVKVAAFDFVVP